ALRSFRSILRAAEGNLRSNPPGGSTCCTRSFLLLPSLLLKNPARSVRPWLFRRVRRKVARFRFFYPLKLRLMPSLHRSFFHMSYHINSKHVFQTTNTDSFLIVPRFLRGSFPGDIDRNWSRFIRPLL